VHKQLPQSTYIYYEEEEEEEEEEEASHSWDFTFCPNV
jgi:hypothetical protein